MLQVNIHNASNNYGRYPVLNVVFVVNHDVKEDNVANPNKTSLNKAENYEYDCHVVSVFCKQI